MACLGIPSLRGLLPAWLKWFFDTQSNSDQPYTSSSRNTSPQGEGSRSPAPHQSPINPWYVPGITMLPSPPPAYPFTTSQSAAHGGVNVYGYQECEPFSFNRTSPIPREKATSLDNDLHEPPIIFSPTSDMHAADQPMKSSSQYIIIFFFGGVFSCTNSIA